MESKEVKERGKKQINKQVKKPKQTKKFQRYKQGEIVYQLTVS
jgi:hypothetical protein